MLTTLLATIVLSTQEVPTLTYISSETDRFPNSYPANVVEYAKSEPTSFMFRGHTWEVHYIEGEYVAIDIDATGIALLRSFCDSMTRLSQELTISDPTPSFTLRKGDALTQIALTPFLKNEEMLVSSAKLSLRVEVEFADRFSSDMQVSSGSLVAPQKERMEVRTDNRISELDLSEGKQSTFNPPWNLSVSSFEIGIKPEVLQNRQRLATEVFWTTYNKARTQARDGFDIYVNRLQQFSQPLSFWDEDLIGKRQSELPTNLLASLNETNSFDNPSVKRFKDADIKSVRLGLSISFSTRKNALSDPNATRVTFYRP